MDFFLPENIEFLTRLIVAAFLGMLIGFEREITGKYAGIRTYGLVSLGAALFTILATDVVFGIWGSNGFDPGRIIGQIVLGVGFLGAGLIFFQKERVYNLTTAAAVWVTAAIGAAAGLQSYGLAISATLISLFILIVIRWVEEIFEWRENAQK
jgi:putative Mg2+ transporter-C (MgtC) family protein